MGLRDKGKPFVVYRRTTGFFTIVPRGFKGWAQFAIWIAQLAPLAFWFSRYTKSNPAGRDLGDSMVLLGIGVVIWLIGGIWYMLARSEVVDVAELKRDQQVESRRQRRSR